ncbi:MAG: ribosome small subunit-dependent GTPase A [Sporolactobacillus sp.]
MPEGTIIKALSGYYYVKNDQEVVQCRARGVFRKRKINPLVGDTVTYEAENLTDGYILAVGKRKNVLNRPPIANIDQALLVFSVAEPNFDRVLLDRFLVHMESHHIFSIICLTKCDLLDEKQMKDLQETIDRYRAIGYPVLKTSSARLEGLEAVLDLLNGKISVVTGQSGVGKSSLLNELNQHLKIDTQAISHSLGRGKHTTRHVELLPVGDGFVADTPGFSSLDFSSVELEELPDCFPEFRSLSEVCRFRGCTHIAEPDCAVKAALEEGKIDKDRYAHYHLFFQEISQRKKIY